MDPILSGIPGFCKPVRNGNGIGNGHRRSPREYNRNGVCLAALRAITAAQLYRDPQNAFTLAECALRCGSCVVYVRAAFVLLEHADHRLIDMVVRGKRHILEAARSVEALVKLTNAYKAVAPEQAKRFCADAGLVDLSTTAKRTEAASKLGVDLVWDDMVAPLVSTRG
jgi:hypothetical protein